MQQIEHGLLAWWLAGVWVVGLGGLEPPTSSGCRYHPPV